MEEADEDIQAEGGGDVRLIDADALIAKQASIAKTFARSDAQKSLIGRVMYNTEKSPTIDAIPVEWLDDRANDITRAPLFRRYAQQLLDEWQKEQEAR